MIDPTIRKLRISEEASYDDVAVIVLDFVLGYGSNPDPVGSAIDEIRNASCLRKPRDTLALYLMSVGREETLKVMTDLDKIEGCRCSGSSYQFLRCNSCCRYSGQRAYRLPRGIFTVYWRNPSR